MSASDEAEHRFAEAMLQQVAAAADPILRRLLRDKGVDFEDLSRPEQTEVLKTAFLQATAAKNPFADFDGLRRVFDCMGDTRFTTALSNLRAQPYGAAFDPSIGPDAAIVLAGAGLEVFPLDKKNGRRIGEAATSIDQAVRIFGRAKSAWVGYSPAAAPFYLAVTDCVVTMYGLLRNHPRFADLKARIEESGPFPAPPVEPRFRHGMMLFARQPSDMIETLAIEDDSPDRGSIMFLAGWLEQGQPNGVPNDGALPVPAQLVRKLIENPRVLQWLTRPVGGYFPGLH
jgi:hypothetical protein